MITFDALRAMKPREGGSECLSIKALIKRGVSNDFPLNVSPEYQRVRKEWTDDQQSKFMGFLAEGGDAPCFWIQRWEDCNISDELVDGLQRFTAIQRFVNNEIPMELTSGERYFLKELSPEDQRLLIGNAGPMLLLKYVQFRTKAEVLRFYLRFNRGGTVHSDEEIQRVEALYQKEISQNV